MTVHTTPRGPTANQILAALPQEEYARLEPHLHPVALHLGEVLHEPGQPINYVHFPTGGVIATVVVMAGGATAEAGMAGSEGMACLSTFLGCDTTPFRAVVENPGEALQLKSDAFKAAVSQCQVLHGLMHRYADAFLCMVLQTAGCNALHPLEQRCCRWLLMTLDRAQADHFLLTQEFLAQKMGATRTSVSDVARGLQDRGLISYSRGKVAVRDRGGLEAASCECYRRIKAKYDALRDRPAPAPPRGNPELGRTLGNLPAAAYTCDGDGYITSFNRSAVELWGREPRLNDAADRYCGSFKLFSPDGPPVPHDQCCMALAVQEDREYAGRKIVIERPDGSRRTVLAHARPLHDELGRVCGGVNVLVDITDHKP